METQHEKMRIIARERFKYHLVSGPWFLNNAIEWFDTQGPKGGFVLMRLPTQWTAVFKEDKDDPDKHPVKGHGTTALEAVTDLLWEMRSHA